MRKLYASIAVVALGCEAEVVLEDGGGLQGGATGSATTTGSAAGGAADGGAGGGSTPSFDYAAACAETCARPCVGGPSICEQQCLDIFAPNCEREAFAFYECSMWYCDPMCDLDELENALHGCLNPFYCGHAGNELSCDEDAEVCDCVGSCDDDHVGRIACTPDGICDCWFDGEHVATCESNAEGDGCNFQLSCCGGYMLPGGGPAAGG